MQQRIDIGTFVLYNRTMARLTEIQAKTLLSHVKQPDDFFGLKYNMNLYRGCQHRCIYCDSRSKVYGIEHFDTEVRYKGNAVEKLDDELGRKRIRGTIGTGSMNDPFMPAGKKLGITRDALKVIAKHRFPVHAITKSDLVLDEIDTLAQIADQNYAAVSFTITTTDDKLAKQVEPGAPIPSARLAAMRQLADAGVTTGVTMMPILPFLEDTPENITSIVESAAKAGASYILAGFGLTMREGQREYFYNELAKRFPGLEKKYAQRYGWQYSCDVPNAKELSALFKKLCKSHGIARRIPKFEPVKISKGEREGAEQMRLF